MRRAAFGMPTSFRCSSAFASAAARETSLCSRTASRSWCPIVRTGLSDVIGSWKIIAISLPRSSRSRSCGMVSRFSPLKSACPVVRDLRRSLRPMIVRHVTLLPEPDSPTIPSVRPLSMVKLTPSTARTTPSPVTNSVVRSLTSSSAPEGTSLMGLPEPDTRVDERVEEVDDQIRDAVDRGDDQDARLDLREVLDVDRVDEQLSHPRVGEDGLRDRRAAEQEPELEPADRHQRQERVAESVPADHLRPRGALCVCRADVVVPERLEQRRPRHSRHEA